MKSKPVTISISFDADFLKHARAHCARYGFDLAQLIGATVSDHLVRHDALWSVKLDRPASYGEMLARAKASAQR